MEQKAALECGYAPPNDFSGCKADWASALCDSVLRADWTASTRTTNEWATALRSDSRPPTRDHSASAPTGLYFASNSAVVLWLPRFHSSFRTLANALAEKACRAGRLDGFNKSSASLAQETDGEVPVRYHG